MAVSGGLGRGEEPGAGVWVAPGRQVGQHLWEASVAAGRTSNASGSCSPDRSGRHSRGFISAERHPGSGKNREGTFLLVPLLPYLDEPSFLLERKVSR